MVIRGFTDNQADAVSNRGLSLSRAIEVQQWLTLRNGGRPIARQVIIEAFGAATPVAPNTTDAGRSRNRRVEILLCQAPPPPPAPPLVASVLRIQMGKNVG
jgi:OmpA-OmpF porin, OOP family